MPHNSKLSQEARELLVFDALRVSLGFVHGLEREQLCRSLRAAGMVRHQAADGCETWHWPGCSPAATCRHGLLLEVRGSSEELRS